MSESFCFGQLVKDVLVSYANQEIFLINIPKNIERNISDQVLSRRVEFILNGNDEKEAKAIQLLNKIRLKKKNDFLKNLLRGYMCGPVVSSYFANDEDKKESILIESAFNNVSEINQDVKLKNRFKKKKKDITVQNEVIIKKKPLTKTEKNERIETENVKPQKQQSNIPISKTNSNNKPKLNLSTVTETVNIENEIEENEINEEDSFMNSFENLMAAF